MKSKKKMRVPLCTGQDSWDDSDRKRRFGGINGGGWLTPSWRIQTSAANQDNIPQFPTGLLKSQLFHPLTRVR